MNVYKIIDQDNWPRKKLFDFYRKFENPSFNVSVALDGGNLFSEAKKRGESFFLVALYAILQSANEITQMRQRFIDGKVVEFEKIAVMTPIMTEQQIFCQIWCDYEDTFEAFKAQAAPKIEAAKHDDPSPMPEHNEDFFCASCVPWLHFTSLTQADYTFSQAIPVLTWGKIKDGIIPVSCRFNHCFMDGLHVSVFFNELEKRFGSMRD